MFDPHHKWLGIPKDQRPPTHYQLLGIAPDETDAEVIDEAAIRQSAHVRAYQIGLHAKECTQILNELAQARTVLLNPAKRKAYDAQLALKAPKKKEPTDQITAAPPAPATAFADMEVLEPAPVKRSARASIPNIAKEGIFLTRPMLYGIIGGGVGLLLVAVLIFVFNSGDPAPKPVATAKDKDQGADPSKKKDDVEPKIAKKDDIIKPMTKIINPPPDKIIPVKKVEISGKEFAPGAEKKFGRDIDTRAVLSPDGKSILLSHGGAESLTLMDVETGALIRRYNGQNLTFASFVNNGAQIAVGAGARFGRIHLFDTTTGDEIRSFTDPMESGGHFLTLAPDNEHVLSGDNGALRLFSLKTGEVVRRFAGTAEYGVFTSDGRFAVTCGQGFIRVWNVSTGAETQKIQVRKGALVGNHVVALSPDEKHILGGNILGQIQWFDFKTGNLVHEIDAHKSAVQALDFSSDGKWLLSGDGNGSVRVWDFARREVVWKYEVPGPVYTGRFVLDGQTLLLAGNAARLVPWKPESPSETPTVVVKKEEDKTKIFGPPEARRASLSPDGKRLLVSVLGEAPALYDVETGKLLRKLKMANPTAIPEAFFFGDAQILACALDGLGSAHLFKSNGDNLYSKALGDPKAADRGLRFVTPAPDGAHVLTNGVEGCARVLNLKKGFEVKRYTGHAGFVIDGDFTPDGSLVVTLAVDGAARFWDANTTNRRGGVDIQFKCMAMAKKKPLLALGNHDAVRVYDLTDPTSQRVVQQLKHGERITALGFSSDDSKVIFGDAAGMVGVLDLSTSNTIWRQRVAEKPVRSVAFGLKDQLLLVACEGARLISWQDEPVVAASSDLLDPRYWQPNGVLAKFAKDEVSLHISGGDPMMVSKQVFSPPVTLRAVVQTNSTNVRMYYGKSGVIILNWESKLDELRVHDPRTTNQTGFPGKGYILQNIYHDISWEIHADAMKLLVNGEERMAIKGDYRGLSGTLGIGPCNGSTIKLKLLEVKAGAK